MMLNNAPIGIFDSGVGGLSILKAIYQLMPNENLIYVADSAFVPYGNKTKQEIESRVLTIAAQLADKKIKAMVVACNTATAAAVNTLRGKYKFPIIGLEPAIKSAAINTRNAKVGVLATQATLDSQKYLDLKKKFASHLKLLEKASPLFVDLVENAPSVTAQELTLIEKELASFKLADVDSLVLGCTHYPFLAKIITKIMGPEVTLYDSGMPVALELKRRLGSSKNHSDQKGFINYFSSAPDKSQQAFDLLLGEKTHINSF